MLKKLRYLLMQIRNPDDPMRSQEIDCFAQALHSDRHQIQVFDLLSGVPSCAQLDQVDMVLLGGSGHYSAASQGEWLELALDSMRRLFDLHKPTFASCWGFQAMARALGGRVINDPDRAELGTHEICLTEEGRDDPVFGFLGERFFCPNGTRRSSYRLAAGSDTVSIDRASGESGVSLRRSTILLHSVPSRTGSQATAPASRSVSRVHRRHHGNVLCKVRRDVP